MGDNFLDPEGSPQSKIAFIQDAPTDKDVYEREFYSGYVGELFNMLLGRARINKHKTYRTSLIKSGLSSYDYTRYLNRGQINYSPQYKAWVEYLRRELSRTDCNVFVPMGELAFHALTGLRGHTKYRGSILPCTLIPGRKVIGCYSPSSMMSQYNLMPFLQFDLGRINKESDDRIIEVESENFIIEPDYNTVMDYLIDIEKNASIVSWDIETAGQAVSCIGFTTDTVDGICVPLTIPGQNRYWGNRKEAEILRMISKVLRSPNYKQGGQNIFYDYCFMIKTLNIVPSTDVWDTMVAHHCCYAELPKDLGTLTSLYTKYPYYKDEGKVWTYGVQSDKHMTQQQKLEQYWRYNVKDTHRTLTAWWALEKEMSDLGVRDVHDMIMEKYMPIATYMTCRGMKYNKQKQSELALIYDKDIKVLADSMVDNYNLPEDTNFNSVLQMKQLFYSNWGMKEKKNRKTKAVTVDDTALRSLQREYPRHAPFIQDLQKLRGMRKLRSTYLGLDTSDFDGRIHFGYKIVGTLFGRWASGESPFRDGTNGQNIPDSTRFMVEAEDGYTFINADLSQAEARIVAMLGQEMALLAVFESGEDIHAQNANNIFACGLEHIHDEFAAGKSYRDIGKKVVHASNYDMSAFTFAQQTGLKKTEAQKCLDNYFDMYPGIKRYHRWVQKELRAKHMLETPYGRKIQFFGRMNDQTFKQGYACIPQSTVGDILNHGVYNIFTEIPEVELVLQVHDSILVRCPDALVDSVIPRMRECMSIPITINGITHTIPVDFQKGKNWGKRKEKFSLNGELISVKNADGLVELNV